MISNSFLSSVIVTILRNFRKKRTAFTDGWWIKRRENTHTQNQMILSQRDCCNITASGTKMSNTHCWVEQLCSHRPIAGEGPGLPSTQVTIQTDRCRRFEKKERSNRLFLSASRNPNTSQEPFLPECLADQLDEIRAVLRRNVLAGCHRHQAGDEDIPSHEAELGGLELTQEWSKLGDILRSHFGEVVPLKVHSKYDSCSLRYMISFLPKTQS